MDILGLENLEVPPLITTNSPIFSPLVSFAGEPGTLPLGTAYTITGNPGAGKTKYALQVLDNIAQYNSDIHTVYHEFEQIPAAAAHTIRTLGTRYIHEFNLIGEMPKFKTGSIHIIDSLDAFAAKHFDADFPDAKLAGFFQSVLERGVTIFFVHHKAKTGRKESGSAKFHQMVSGVFDLYKSGTGVTVSCDRKFRYPGEVSSIALQHTSKGLVLEPTFGQKVAAFLQNWKR